MVSQCEHNWQRYDDPDWMVRYEKCGMCGRMRLSPWNPWIAGAVIFAIVLFGALAIGTTG